RTTVSIFAVSDRPADHRPPRKQAPPTRAQRRMPSHRYRAVLRGWRGSFTVLIAAPFPRNVCFALLYHVPWKRQGPSQALSEKDRAAAVAAALCVFCAPSSCSSRQNASLSVFMLCGRWRHFHG
ncbi:Enamine/imine deaminase, partial [Dysosmobacter welbionis]